MSIGIESQPQGFLDLLCCRLSGIPMRHYAGHIADLCDIAVVAWNLTVPDADFVIFGGGFHVSVCFFS